jgi:hypothetical protein
VETNLGVEEWFGGFHGEDVAIGDGLCAGEGRVDKIPSCIVNYYIK